MKTISTITFEHINDTTRANAKLEYIDPLNRAIQPLNIRVYEVSSLDLYAVLVNSIKKHYNIDKIEEKTYRCFNDMPFFIRHLNVSHFIRNGRTNVTQEVVKLIPEFDNRGGLRNSENGLIKQKAELDSCGNYATEGYLDGWLPR